MKKFLIAVSAFALVACSSSAQIPCLAKGEAAKILDMTTLEPTLQRSDDGYVTLLLTTDNKTVRVCRAKDTNVQILRKGQIVRGYTDKPQYDWPFPNWYRIG